MKRFFEDGLSFGVVLTIIFLLLQACKIINWSVWWLLAPLWMPIAITIVLGGLIFIFSMFAAMVAISIEKRRLKKDK